MAISDQYELGGGGILLIYYVWGYNATWPWTHHKFMVFIYFFLWLYSPIQAMAVSMKLSVSLQLLDLGQLVDTLDGWSACRKASTCTQTQKNAHTTQTQHLCPEWDSNPRSLRPHERRQFMP
jgi:hypothetical protein